ncbi:MAG: DNA-binding protein [Chloroflexota bacterium]
MKKAEQVNDLPKLSAPAHRALASINVATLADVSKHTEAEVAKLHGVGPTIIVALREALAEKGLAFKAGKS